MPDLRYADLSDADLRVADLHNADLRHADLSYADLRVAKLSGADLRHADLSDADLRYADLSGADLSGADLHNADLRHAKLPELTVAQTSILPDEGDIIGWKKAYVDSMTPVIVKLLIPSDADLQDKQGSSLPPNTTAHSSYDTDFEYKKGETVSVENFDTNRWNQCAPGIHFFITRIEAVEY